jgi:NAD(P)-dependent dehydrogenase (short-subunit alcohol dehydrogenase family)
MSANGKVVLVTGASRGIGRATARLFAAAGNRVAQPEEIARTLVFLGTEAPDFLTGCIIDVNGASYLRS